MKTKNTVVGPVFHTPEFADIHTFIDPAGPQDSTGEIWFAARDLCRILGYSGSISRTVISHTAPGERVKHPLIDSLGRTQQGWYVNESGLNAMILASRLPEARRFRQYVTSVILPAVRKYGAYIEPQTLAAVQEDPEALSTLIKSLALESERRKGLEAMLKSRENDLAQTRASLTQTRKKLKMARNQGSHYRYKIRRLRPDARFARQIRHSSADNITVYALAKLLHGAGVDTGGKRLFAWLRENGYLCATPCYFNHPTQASMDKGLMVLAEKPAPKGRRRAHLQPLITGRGQQHFLSLFTQKAGPEAPGGLL